MSKIIKIEFDVEVPDIDHTPEQLEEWLRFELNDNGSCSADNPFLYNNVNPILGTFEFEEV